MSTLLLLGGVTRFVVTGFSWEVVVVLEEVGGIGPAQSASATNSTTTFAKNHFQVKTNS